MLPRDPEGEELVRTLMLFAYLPYELEVLPIVSLLRLQTMFKSSSNNTKKNVKKVQKTNFLTLKIVKMVQEGNNFSSYYV